MRSFLLSLVVAIVAMVLWAGLVFIGTLNGWGKKPLAPPETQTRSWSRPSKKIGAKHRGKAALRLIENGKLHDEYFAGDSVDSETLFQVASLSKWISAWGVMTLVETGKLDLDAPVTNYLTRWTLPESEFANSKVTVRRLLSHMAGLTDGLGYAGFAPGAKVQSLEESLTRAADASPGGWQSASWISAGDEMAILRRGLHTFTIDDRRGQRGGLRIVYAAGCFSAARDEPIYLCR